MSIGFWQIAIVVVLVVLLFGRGKISSLMGDVAKGIKSFKKGMADNPDQSSSTTSSSEDKPTEDQDSEKKQSTMPQIGWFEILIIVILAVLVIGPKDFPIVLKKIGNWIGSTKRYFSDIQQKFTETVEEDISVEEKFSKKKENKKLDE